MVLRIHSVAVLFARLGLVGILAIVLGCDATIATPLGSARHDDLPLSRSVVMTPRLMQGKYNYTKNAAMCVGCQTSTGLPVAQEADNAALQSAYDAAWSALGAPIRVTIEGLVLPRPSPEEPMLIVDRFVEVTSQEQHDAALKTVTLEKTHWKLVSLRGKPIDVTASWDPAHRPAYLVLEPDKASLVWSGGCNFHGGTYAVEGEQLTVQGGHRTLRICRQEMHHLDRELSAALSAVARWRIDQKQQLHLMDAHGATLAVFEPSDQR